MNLNCYECGEEGHIRRDCPSRQGVTRAANFEEHMERIEQFVELWADEILTKEQKRQAIASENLLWYGQHTKRGSTWLTRPLGVDAVTRVVRQPPAATKINYPRPHPTVPLQHLHPGKRILVLVIDLCHRAMVSVMAEKLESFTPAALKTSTRSIYPWHEWMDGSVWKITRGADFTCQPDNMRAAIMTHAYRKARTVRTHVVGETVEFQFSPLTNL